MRAAPDLIAGISRAAARSGGKPGTLAAEMLEEGYVMRVYPGIYFRFGEGGRRPALVGTRVDVAHVARMLRRGQMDVPAIADYLHVRPGQVRSAAGYYADHRDEVDRWLEREDVTATELEAGWHRSGPSRPA